VKENIWVKENIKEFASFIIYKASRRIQVIIGKFMNCPGLSTTKAQEKPRMGRCIRGAQVDTNGTEKAFEAVVFYLSTSLRRNEIVLLFRA
jgi:hypothetical protein